MSTSCYITTPIYYVNDVPHIGHAYTSVISDVIARSMRLLGDSVLFVTGTDEHGQKVYNSAVSKSLTPKIFVDNMSNIFKNLMYELNISNNDFIRTTELRHINYVKDIWKQLYDNGNIYLGKYAGWYSARDEAFYSSTELCNGLAPTGANVEWIEEESYFFKLSSFQDSLLNFYHNNPNFIQPNSKFNEVINFVKSGLKDLSISRTAVNWGIQAPNNNHHIIYVWFDALLNYISVLEDKSFSQYWPANVHIIGKDILRFHAVYWPAILMALGLDLPKCILVHGWWTNDGEKISKSLGNIIDPLLLIKEFGVDQIRYFLVRDIFLGSDGNFVRKNLINRINTELVNKIGNLFNRVTQFVHQFYYSSIPYVKDSFIDSIYNNELIIKKAVDISLSNILLLKTFQINKILANILLLVEESNNFISVNQPWLLRKYDIKKTNEVMYIMCEILRYIIIMLQPFIPNASNKMLNQLNISLNARNYSVLNRFNAIIPGTKIIYSDVVIFPKVIL